MSDPTGGLLRAVMPGPEVSYGADVSSDGELRLCGDVRGKRVMELGVYGPTPNSVALALKGARTIAVDPVDTQIAKVRQAAEQAEVKVECHRNELADLGFATSSLFDLVICVHQVSRTNDIARLFRQVHRLLKTEASFVLAVTHPAADIFEGSDPTARHKYGSRSPGIGNLVMSLQRANFAINAMHELSSMREPRAVVPSTLVLRAHKLGS